MRYLPMLMRFADSDTAAAHLLRHLHDADALRHNPLVAHVFAEGATAPGADAHALARVHDMVVSTAERIFSDGSVGRNSLHLRRQFEIMMRCDIRGELHKAVQDDMGLGRRQFYRERERGRMRLAKALEALVPAKLSGVAVAFDTRKLEYTQIRALRDAGRDEEALGAILRLLNTSPAEDEKLELLTLACEIQAEAGEFAEANAFLERARALSLSGPHVIARIAYAEAELAVGEGRFLAAERSSTVAATSYQRLPIPRTLEQDEFLVSAYLLCSLTRHAIGEYESALSALQSARDIVERRPDLPVTIKVRLLEHLGASQMTLPGSRALVESHLLEAYTLAQRNGLVPAAIRCMLYLSRIRATAGEVDALRVGREALAMARTFNGRGVYGWQCATFATIELALGNYREAIQLAKAARACNDSEVIVSRAGIIEAEALLGLGDPSRACVLALAAIETFRKNEHARFLGPALRVASEAAFRLGNMDFARYAIKESLELLERFGHPSSFEHAQRLASKLEISK